ncbi:prepilin-type N-terminal cleavage/methylation domain-containing protein, partial [Pseudomonas sp. CCC4.3]
MSKQAKGFGLIEMMIALVLGLVVVAGIIQVFIAARGTYVSQNASATMQEDARYALSKMVQEIRMVGMFGCLATVKDASSSSNFTPNFYTPISFTTDASGASILTMNTADVGSNGGAPTWTIVSDCVTSATAYDGVKAPVSGQVAFPIRNVVYTFKNNQLYLGSGAAAAVLVNNVKAFNITFGMAGILSATAVSSYSATPTSAD